MIEKFDFKSFEPDKEAPKEMLLLSIISQSFFQPFSLEDNLLVILTALTSGSGVGFNRAMLFLRDGDRLKGEMWLGPSSAEEAGYIWEVLSTPGIGYIEIVEHNRALVRKNEDTLSGRVRDLVYAAGEQNALIPALASCRKEILLVKNANDEPLVDRRFLDIIRVNEFLCIPLLARDEVLGEIVLDNAITQTPIGLGDIKLASLCGLIAGNYIYSASLHRKLLEMEKTAALGEMAMFVTHQIRNPIVAIGGFAEQLLQPGLPEDKRDRNIRIIRDETRRLEDIIFQMGHFLKVSLKEPVYFDPGPIIDSVIESPEIQSKKQTHDLRVDIEDGLPLIFCDPMSFGEVLRNLLDNSFDATPPGGRVSVRGYRKTDGWYILSVRDTGKGITNPDKDRLFKPFFTTKDKGMGLGLPFIKRVMDTCGGKVEVRSRAGSGALFKLHFQSRERE